MAECRSGPGSGAKARDGRQERKRQRSSLTNGAVFRFFQCFRQGGATGRLLRYSPETGKTECLAEGIWYANGVALSADESFVLVVETWTLRVLRFWLKGPKVRYGIYVFC